MGLINILPENKTRQDKELPVIKCYCGFKILLIPNVKEMSKAIDAHVAEHKKKTKDPLRAEHEAEAIENYLIKQLFDATSKLP